MIATAEFARDLRRRIQEHVKPEDWRLSTVGLLSDALVAALERAELCEGEGAFANYQREAMKFALPECRQLTNVALGLCGEAGEFSEHVKKHLFQWKKLDREHLQKELGDVLWYLALACETLGLSLQDVATTNIEKLAKRWPNGVGEGKDVR